VRIRKEPTENIMKLSSLRGAALATLALVAVGAFGEAQIERLNLDQMVARTDNAVIGQITASKVFRVDDPVDGPELYYTTLTVRGRSLENGKAMTVPVTFPGGFISPEQGAHNSEAPAADEIRIGNEVVVFYKWSDNMGGHVAGNALYASHGGLYRVVRSGADYVALGKGEGYALDKNWKLQDLDTEVTRIHDVLQK